MWRAEANGYGHIIGMRPAVVHVAVATHVEDSQGQTKGAGQAVATTQETPRTAFMCGHRQALPGEGIYERGNGLSPGLAPKLGIFAPTPRRETCIFPPWADDPPMLHQMQR